MLLWISTPHIHGRKNPSSLVTKRWCYTVGRLETSVLIALLSKQAPDLFARSTCGKATDSYHLMIRDDNDSRLDNFEYIITIPDDER